MSFEEFSKQSKLQKRKQGSCRFAPYYKVQWWDEIAATWRDMQKKFDTKGEAENSFISGKKCRIMEVTMNGRTVI